MARTKQTARWYDYKPSAQDTTLPTAADRPVQQQQREEAEMSPRQKEATRLAGGIGTRSSTGSTKATAKATAKKVQTRGATRGAREGTRSTKNNAAPPRGTRTARRRGTPSRANNTTTTPPTATNTVSPSGTRKKTNEEAKETAASLENPSTATNKKTNEEAKETAASLENPSTATNKTTNEKAKETAASLSNPAASNEQANHLAASLPTQNEPSFDRESESFADDSDLKPAADDGSVNASDETKNTDNTTTEGVGLAIVSTNGGTKYGDTEHMEQETMEYSKIILELVGNDLDIVFRMAHRETVCTGSGDRDDPKLLYNKLQPIVKRLGIASKKIFDTEGCVSAQRLGWQQLKQLLYDKIEAKGTDMGLYTAQLRGADEEADSTQSFTLEEDDKRDGTACAFKMNFAKETDNMDSKAKERYAALLLHEKFEKDLDLEEFFTAWSNRPWSTGKKGSNEFEAYWKNYGDSLLQAYKLAPGYEKQLQWTTMTRKQNRSLNLCFAKPERSPEEYKPDKQVFNELQVRRKDGELEDWLFIGNALFGKKKVFSVVVAKRAFLPGEVIGCVKPDPNQASEIVEGHAPGERLKSGTPVSKNTYFGRDKDLFWIKHYKPQFDATSNVCMGLHRCMNVMGFCTPGQVESPEKFAAFINRNANCELTENGLVIARKRINPGSVMSCLYPTPGIPLSHYKFNKMLLDDLAGGWPTVKTEEEPEVETKNRRMSNRNAAKRKSPPQAPTESAKKAKKK